MEVFCRGCLVKFNDPTELLQYTEKNRRLFVYSTGLQVKRNDPVTFQLCKDCYVNMKLSCKFKKQCRTSDKKLQQYMSLKETGDAADLCTFIRNMVEDSLRFPSLSGHSTPAYNRTREDDNESTCTSIHNFMSDILQGEEMPYSEAQIIKEVIEEAADVLEDSLDSHWLQDDASIDTNFRLDLSFSPFSTPRPSNTDNWSAPQKTIDSIKSNHNNTVKNKIDQLIKEKNDHEQENLIEQVVVCPPTIKPNEIKSIPEPNNESQNSFTEFIDQTMNYFTQNENDIAVQPISPIVGKVNVNSDNNITMYSETEIAVKNINSIITVNNHDSDIFTENKSISKSMALETNNINNEENDHVNFMIQKETDLAVKFIESKNITDDIKIEFILETNNVLSSNEFNDNIADSEDKSKQKVNNIEINQININNEDKLDVPDKSEDHNENKNHDILFDFKEICVSSVKSSTSHEANQSVKSSKNRNIADVVDNKDDFSFGDLLLSPAEYRNAPGASTPMINNILFGEKLELEDNTSQSSRLDDKVDILDEMLKDGVKEFGMDVDEKYDLEKFYCKACEKQFQSLKALKIHLAKCHQIKFPKIYKREFDKKKRICDKCGVEFNDFANFMRHVKMHEQTDIKCNVCKLVFSSKSKLNMHSKSHQALRPIEIEKTPTTTKKFVCSICGIVLTTVGNFAVHMRRHNKQFVVSCDECGQGFYRTTDLTIHKRQHTGERPFSCEFCELKFARRYNLIKHMKHHLDDRPFQCEHCDLKFVLRSGLVQHLKRSACQQKRVAPKKKSKAKPFKCYYCTKKFTNKCNLVRHQQSYAPCIEQQAIVQIRNRSTIKVLYQKKEENIVENSQDNNQDVVMVDEI